MENKAKKTGGIDFKCHIEVRAPQGLTRQFNELFTIN